MIAQWACFPRVLAVGFILGWVAQAAAEPIDALDPTVQAYFSAAEAAEKEGNASSAAGFYRLVLIADPSFLPASLALGRCLEATGDLVAAEALYRSLPNDADAVDALARLIAARLPEEALSLYKRLETLRLGDAGPYREEARLYAEIVVSTDGQPAPRDADAALVAWRMYATLLQGDEPDGDTLLAMSSATGADGERLLMDYVATFPAGTVAAEARTRLDRADLARAALTVDLGGDEPLDATQAGMATRAEVALAAGRNAEALATARALVSGAPRSAVAHGLYSDALAAGENVMEAEREARVARRLAPDDPASRARYGWLLHSAYGGTRDAEAVAELREAVRLRPGEVELRGRLGQVEQALGEFEAAERTFDAVVAADPEGPAGRDAALRLAALRRIAPPEDASPPTTANLPAAAIAHAQMARELLARGRIEEGVMALDAALLAAPDAPFLLNQRARLDFEAGRSVEADERWRRSLRADPNQPNVWRQLGDIAVDAVDRRRAWAEAASRGDTDAHFKLADLAARAGEWDGVRAELSAYETRASPYSVYRESARTLRREADRRFWGIRIAIGSVIAIVSGIPLAVLLRRRTARTLRDLLDGAPESWHEAARLLAGIRHEVLKHNTTVLPDVADALERGDVAPWRQLHERLPALIEKLDVYLGALEALGARHRIRVDLRHRDPVMAPAWRAFRRLARARRSPSPADLRAYSLTINGETYGALGRLVREICVLPIESELVEDAWKKVSGEPGFVGSTLPSLVISADDGLALRMFRNDIEDILANLLRNALAAGAKRIGVDLLSSEDPITGHPLVCIAAWDDAPGTLTNAMIRGRYIGRGLGLAVDLVNRHGGAITVEDRGDGVKAVVVEFPAVEAAYVEAEWTA